MLRYESLKEQPEAELAKVAAFLRECSFRAIDASREKLQRAIDLSSSDRMRELEKQQASQWILTRETRSDKPFVRSAISGGWKTQLPSPAIAAAPSSIA